MNPASVGLRLRRDVSACETDDGMVLLDERAGRYWQLNTTGALIVRALLEGATPAQVADTLTTRTVAAETAMADIDKFLADLTAAGLIDSAVAR